ncbi:MAG: hypothetical protein JXB50_14775 [Spirochaetes bacterium]|nr:hypothetical protein [Spirochaetota bacterium]
MKRLFIIVFILTIMLQNNSAKSQDDHVRDIKQFIELQLLQEAEASAFEAINEYPEDLIFYTLASWVFREEKKFKDAEIITDMAVKKFGMNDELKNEIISNENSFTWHLISINKFDEALIHAEKSFDLDKNNQWSILAYGNALFRTKNGQKAVLVLEEGYAKYPVNLHIKSSLAFAYCEYGTALYNDKNYEEYQITLKKAYELLPDTDFIINCYAICLIRVKDYENAIMLLKDGITKFPEYKFFRSNLIWAYSEYADNLKNEKRLKEYYRYKKEAYDLDPDNERLINDYALSLIISQDYENAFRILNEKIKLFPDYLTLKDTLSSAYSEYADKMKVQNNQEEYIKYKKTAYDTAPDKEWIINEYALSLIYKKDYINAINLLSEALKKYPDYKLIKENLDKLTVEYENSLKTDIQPQKK